MATTAKDWKGRANRAIELELPSGNMAMVRNPGMEAFLQAGLIPNELMPIILEAMDKNEMPDLEGAEKDPEKLMKVLDLANNVLVYCVVEPAVAPVPAEGVTRDEDTLYADEVSLEDKMFIFQWAVGGTSDLETFRKEQASAMEPVPAGPAVARPAKRAPRTPPRKRR